MGEAEAFILEFNESLINTKGKDKSIRILELSKIKGTYVPYYYELEDNKLVVKRNLKCMIGFNSLYKLKNIADFANDTLHMHTNQLIPGSSLLITGMLLKSCAVVRAVVDSAKRE